MKVAVLWAPPSDTAGCVEWAAQVLALVLFLLLLLARYLYGERRAVGREV